MSTIGISEDKLHHMLGVARKCYSIAKEKGYPESFCQRMFCIGWNHDIGYEFSENPKGHAELSANIVASLFGYDKTLNKTNKNINAIKQHGHYIDKETDEWKILNTADLLINRFGNEVSVYERLNDIKNRYGEYSDEYLTACDIAYQLKLTVTNISRYTDTEGII